MSQHPREIRESYHISCLTVVHSNFVWSRFEFFGKGTCGVTWGGGKGWGCHSASVFTSDEEIGNMAYFSL